MGKHPVNGIDHELVAANCASRRYRLEFDVKVFEHAKSVVAVLVPAEGGEPTRWPAKYEEKISALGIAERRQGHTDFAHLVRQAGAASALWHGGADDSMNDKGKNFVVATGRSTTKLGGTLAEVESGWCADLDFCLQGREFLLEWSVLFGEQETQETET